MLDHRIVYLLVGHQFITLSCNKMDLEQLPWFVTFKLHRFSPSQRGDLVKIHLVAIILLGNQYDFFYICMHEHLEPGCWLSEQALHTCLNAAFKGCLMYVTMHPSRQSAKWNLKRKEKEKRKIYLVWYGFTTHYTCNHMKCMPSRNPWFFHLCMMYWNGRCTNFPVISITMRSSWKYEVEI